MITGYINKDKQENDNLHANIYSLFKCNQINTWAYGYNLHLSAYLLNKSWSSLSKDTNQVAKDELKKFFPDVTDDLIELLEYEELD